jgi:hypothetical protein
MKRKVPPHEGLVSWLKFFDIDYLDNSVCNQLSELDINCPAERAAAIQLAIRPEFESLNEISRSSMLQVLNGALTASDSELAPLFERISMPFQSEVVDRRQLLHSIWDVIGVRPMSQRGHE